MQTALSVWFALCLLICTCAASVVSNSLGLVNKLNMVGKTQLVPFKDTSHGFIFTSYAEFSYSTKSLKPQLMW